MYLQIRVTSTGHSAEIGVKNVYLNFREIHKKKISGYVLQKLPRKDRILWTFNEENYGCLNRRYERKTMAIMMIMKKKQRKIQT